jgi:NAD-dependent dihydropyrimidine dehydrogenase PreA subunit
LQFFPKLCTNCGLCSIVCPHGVFEAGETTARMVNRNACIECGACMLNCEPRAIRVQAGVGCASAMIRAALIGQKEPSCGPNCGSC